MSNRSKKITPIPDDRRVTGNDITELSESFGFTTLDTSYLLGLYLPMLGKMTSDKVSKTDEQSGNMIRGRDKPITDPTRSLLLRLLSKHPEYCPIEPSASPHDLYHLMQQTPRYEDYKLRWLGPMLGCEYGSGYRWFSGSGVSPIIGRYLTIIMSMLNGLSEAERSELFDSIQALAETEASSRDVSTERLWDQGSWSLPKDDAETEHESS